MTPFLLTAALMASPPALQPYQAIDGAVRLVPAPRSPAPFIQPPKVNLCGKLGAQATAPDGVKMFRRLDQLPRGVMEHAVWRTVAGCPVREIVFDGETYYVTSADPKLERGPAVGPRTRRD